MGNIVTSIICLIVKVANARLLKNQICTAVILYLDLNNILSFAKRDVTVSLLCCHSYLYSSQMLCKANKQLSIARVVAKL